MIHWAKFIEIRKDKGLHEGRKHNIYLSHDGRQWNSISLTRKEMKRLVSEINNYLKNLEENANLQ